MGVGGRGGAVRPEQSTVQRAPCPAFLPGFLVAKFSCPMWKKFFQGLSIPVLSPSGVSYHFCLFLFQRGKKSWCQTLARMGRRFARMTASPVAGRESAAFVSARCHESCLSPAAAWRCRGEPRAGGRQQGLVNAQTWGTPRLCVTLAAAGGAQRSLHPQAAFRAGVSGRLAGRRG